MSTAKEMKKQASQMRKMAETMELMEIAQKGGPDAVQNFVKKKFQQKLKRQLRSKVRNAVNKSLGL